MVDSTNSTDGRHTPMGVPKGGTLFRGSITADELRECLAQGVDPRRTTVRGLTAMHVYAMVGNLPATKALIEHGVGVDAVDEMGQTPFLIAVEHGYLELVLCLVAHGASMQTTRADGENALHVAAKAGRLKMVEWLLEGGFPADRLTDQGQTALQIAREIGFDDVVARLMR